MVSGSSPDAPSILPFQSDNSANNDLLPSGNRFRVLPTGRTIYAWGVWDTEKFPLFSIAQLAPRTEDWVSRHRNMSLAILKARSLNKLYSQKVAA